MAHASVTPNSLFTDHAVLQQERPVPVWGTADPGEVVDVEMAGQTASATTGPDGQWMVRLGAMKAGGPYRLTITGKNRIVFDDILVGEVWLASGQSNMERQLGPRTGQRPIGNWRKEVATANYPQIRHFGVAQTKSLRPLSTVKGHWEVCSPATVQDFSAVGHFFARDLYRARRVPVGVIHSSWGGTPAEAWTSKEGLRNLPDYAAMSEQLRLVRTNPEAARRQYEGQLEAWFMANDLGSAKGHSFDAPSLDTNAWKSMTLPTLWEESGEPELNGVVWFRRTFDLPAAAANASAELHLGMVDDVDTTWINGVRVGSTYGYNLDRRYVIPAGALKPGRNVVAVRVLDTGGGGGIWGQEKIQLVFAGPDSLTPVVLSGVWQYRIGMDLARGPWPPNNVSGDTNTPTVLYNGMIAPLVPYAIRGVIWYQGESNVRREPQYRSLFPAMIADWRRAFGQERLPFLFVQIAPHRDMTPELREAQLYAWQHTPNTSMAVTVDSGDANDIHPTRKQPVGARLALAARALAYGEGLEYSGPVFESMAVDGRRVIVRFSHVAGGLVARGGSLRGFAVAGPDNVFVAARAQIRGSTVVVTSAAVEHPVAVRYGWANVPDVNLFNRAGLPASPFRTDGN